MTELLLSEVTNHPTGATLTARLRQATRVEHEAIERVTTMQRLFAADFQRCEYRSLLARLYGFYHALEPTLFSTLPSSAQPLLNHRRKSALLSGDLTILGLTASQLNHLPLCFQLPKLDSFSHRLGVFYVLEGSTLGGQVIRRQLLKHFDTDPDIAGALRFYTAYGEHNGREWRALRQYLDRYGAGVSEIEKMQLISAAKATFASLTVWLAGQPEQSQLSAYQLATTGR